MRLALYEPDIPQNTGTIMRLAACFRISIDIIGPCGFIFSDRRLRRSGMDYIDHVNLKLHDSWAEFFKFSKKKENTRIILLSTKATQNYTDFKFNSKDILLLGRESAGVPEHVHNTADARIIIPTTPETRSLNVAISAAIVIGEALRQTNNYPKIK